MSKWTKGVGDIFFKMFFMMLNFSFYNNIILHYNKSMRA